MFGSTVGSWLFFLEGCLSGWDMCWPFFFQSSGWFYFQSAGRFYFQSEAKGLSVPGGGNSLGAGPTVGVVAEGRYIAVSTVIMVVVDSKTTEYLHVSCSNLIFLGVSNLKIMLFA